MPYAPVRNLGICLMALIAGACIWSTACTAATFELARRTDGTIIRGVKLEGEIVPGDVQKLLEFYNSYGEMVSPIYLRSKGGRVEEAMKMGALIRRLRLETNAPVWDARRRPIDSIQIDHQENRICASACFLVYAGGAKRVGNFFALHRPFIRREGASMISERENEALETRYFPKVKAYLAAMEIDQYWSDRMFAANQKKSYVPTWQEANNKALRLMGIIPSLEEVVLSKCNQAPDGDGELLARRKAAGPLSADDQEKSQQLIEASLAFSQCQETVLADLQSAAFERENDAALNEKCKDFPSLTGLEFLTLTGLVAKGASLTPEEATLRIRLLSRRDAYTQCRSTEVYALRLAAKNRWSEEIGKKQAPNRQ